jgi:hypothetical protein
MTSHPRRDASFIIRIWWEYKDSDTVRAASTPVRDGNIRWRGRIAHAQSGQAIHFDDVHQALSFINRWSGDLESKTHPSNQTQS